MVTIKKAIFLILIVMTVALVGCGKDETAVLDEEQTTLEDAAEQILDKLPDAEQTNECPHECCTKADDWDEKSCEYDRPCDNNRCGFDDCPYDCCSGYEQYARKRCKDGYECIEDDCEAIDDDGDGLLNIEEEDEYGTDPENADTDGDGLSDYEEVKKTKTNATNPNTDGDRYGDAEDSNPLIAIFPEVVVSLTGERVTQHDDNIATLGAAYEEYCVGTVCAVEDLMPIVGDLDLYTIKFTIERENDGDDYTEYTDIKVSIYALSGGKEQRIYESIEERLGMLEDGKADEKDFEIVVKLSDIERGGEGVLAGAATDDRFAVWSELRKAESEGEE